MPEQQPASKYFPTRYGSPGMVFDQPEVDGDFPQSDGFRERIGGSFLDMQFDDAAILALAAAPQQLIAAPGAGRASVVDFCFMFLDVVNGAYDDVAADGDLNLKYGAGADGGAGFITEANGFIDAVASTGRHYGHPQDYVTPANIVVTPVADAAVMLDNDGNEFTSVGNDTSLNTLSIRIYYHIVDFAAFT